jgi:hypothetical protein
MLDNLAIQRIAADPEYARGFALVPVDGLQGVVNVRRFDVAQLEYALVRRARLHGRRLASIGAGVSGWKTVVVVRRHRHQ